MGVGRTTSIRRIAAGDGPSLLAFYNGLSADSKRTFRPLGIEAELNVCVGVIRDNHSAVDDKHDMVVVKATQIIGWGFLHDLTSREPFLGLAIADEWQGRGLGGAVMNAVMAAGRARGLAKVSLAVVQDNAVARGMYERHGFVCSGDFIGEDALPYYRMVAHLGAETKP